MSNGYAADEPRHVEMAAIDEDVRQCVIAGAAAALELFCAGGMATGFYRINNEALDDKYRSTVARALRVLRHLGLLVEHGDGVVSVKEQA